MADPTINYIIASYAAVGKRIYKHPEDTLKIQIRQLYELAHNLTKITLMKARPNQGAPLYENYYFSNEEEKQLKLNVCSEPHRKNIFPLETFVVENQGYSNGQWLRGYERRSQDYDYYIFSEDDYCPGIHHFDKILITLYRNKFPNNIGFMASLIQGKPKHEMELPLHYEGLVVVSKDTMEKLYKWDSNPKRFLSYIEPPFARIMSGGREQVNFTTIFRLADIPVDDTIPEFPFIYWNDCKKDSCGGEIFYFERPEDYSNTVNKYYYENLNTVSQKLYMCIPIQFTRSCILVAGMHRSGTSVFSGALHLSGLDYGKNKSLVTDRFNEHGYFENMTILHFNESVLAHIKSHWHDISPISSNQISAMMEKKDDLIKIIREEFSSNTFFIKDPRISILLPLYLAALKVLCIRVIIVFSDRNNGSISKSLQRAQGVIPNKGIELCHKYKNSLIRFKGDHTIYKFDFTSFLSEPIAHIQDVLNYCNRDQKLTREQEKLILNFVNPKHVHY